MKTLAVHRLDSAIAAAFMAARLPGHLDTDGGVCTLAERLDSAQCFGVFDGAEMIGAYALRVVDHGRRVVIVAAAGRLSEGNLTSTMIPYIAEQARGARMLTVQTKRKGLLARLKAQGFAFGGFIMHKELQCAS